MQAIAQHVIRTKGIIVNMLHKSFDGELQKRKGKHVIQADFFSCKQTEQLQELFTFCISYVSLQTQTHACKNVAVVHFIM